MANKNLPSLSMSYRQMWLPAGDEDNDNDDDVHIRKLWCSTKTASFSVVKQKSLGSNGTSFEKTYEYKHIGSYIFPFFLLLFVSSLNATQGDRSDRKRKMTEKWLFQLFFSLALVSSFCLCFSFEFVFPILLKCSSFLQLAHSVSLSLACLLASPWAQDMCKMNCGTEANVLCCLCQVLVAALLRLLFYLSHFSN